MRTFLDPAVDTPLSQGSGDTAKVPCSSAICRTFRSGGTRIRTGDTMIFRHMQQPLGMRKTRVGKPVYVRRVPLDTTLFYPYCCATVDSHLLTVRGSGSTTSNLMPNPSVRLRSPSAGLRRRIEAQLQREVCRLRRISYQLEV